MTRKLETDGYCYVDVEVRHMTAKAALAASAWLQTFGNGLQLTWRKDNDYRARAVRWIKL